LFLALSQMLQGRADELSAELGKLDPKQADKRNELLQQFGNFKVIKLWCGHAMQIAVTESPEDVLGIAKTLPGFKISPEAARVERLFYSAQLGAQNCFLKDVVKVTAKEFNVSEDAAYAVMGQRDVRTAFYDWSAARGQELHWAVAEATKDEKAQRFNYAAAAHVHATNLTTVSGLIMRWSVLEPDLDDQDNFRYGRTDLLNHLLNTARDTALTNIVGCRKKGLTCVQAISDFEDAELSRDDNDTDKVDVLISYWKASLEAKALMMLMTAENPNERPV
jgi:hypothetical protein